MNDEEQVLVQELIDSLDGTCLHQWSIAAGAGFLILEDPNGRRFSLVITAQQLATQRGSKEP